MNSYTAVNAIPWKLLQYKDAVVGGHISPVHIQLALTNRCNANCNYCACRDVDRKEEIPYTEACEILEYFYDLGARAITLTGGGEPTLHPYFSDIVLRATTIGYEVGLVTNGILHKKNCATLDSLLTWMRVSLLKSNYIESILDSYVMTDLAFSLVVNDSTDIGIMHKVSNHLETKNLTHVRLTGDCLLQRPNSNLILLEKLYGEHKKVIVQDRLKHTTGDRGCYISKLKPFIAANGFVYPCCGVQYATDNTHCLPDQFKMCHWSKYEESSIFDGSICDTCYYDKYNKFLQGLITPLKHSNFL